MVDLGWWRPASHADGLKRAGVEEQRMDVSVFGLEGDPFERDIAVDLACLPELQSSLISDLCAALGEGHGVNAIVGEAGSGKSMLAVLLADSLRRQAATAELSARGLGGGEFLVRVLAQLGADQSSIEAASFEGEDALLELLQSVLALPGSGKAASAVVVDDAEEIPAWVLDGLAGVLDSCVDEEPAFQVYLFGEPRLLDSLNAAGSGHLLDHVLEISRIDALTPAESRDYLSARIRAAGSSLEEVFDEHALSAVVE